MLGFITIDLTSRAKQLYAEQKKQEPVDVRTYSKYASSI